MTKLWPRVCGRSFLTMLAAAMWALQVLRIQQSGRRPLGGMLAFWRCQVLLAQLVFATLSTAKANAIADLLARGVQPAAPTGTIKVSLHTADPGATGANEATGGSYARQTAGYNAASGGVCALAATLSFTVQAATYTHMGIWDSAGTPLFHMGSPLASSVVIGSNGQTIQLTSASLTITGT